MKWKGGNKNIPYSEHYAYEANLIYKIIVYELVWALPMTSYDPYWLTI
jgi:hypothetical protein